MRLENGTISYSPGDLRAFLTCQLATLRGVDALLGRRVPAVPQPPDVLGDRLGEAGRAHQDQVRDEFRRRYGDHSPGREGGVLDLGSGGPVTPTAAADAVALLGTGPQVVAQVPVAAGRLYGAADYLVRVHDRWQLVEVRLGLRLKDVYLAQIGALALGLLSRGVALEADAVLATGRGERLPVPLLEAMDRAREVIAALEAALDVRLVADAPASWDDDSIAACGWCPTCQREMTLARDVRLTAGLRMPDRALLRAAGVRTIDQLAVAAGPIEGLDEARFETLRAQARLQVRQLPPGAELDPSRELPPVFEVYDRSALDALPSPSDGDLFFDFESDPMWDGGDARGLHYLFGMVLPDARETYLAFWAHDRDAELAALRDFVRLLTERLVAHPDLHVYHYSSYEIVVLQEIAKRHGFAEQVVDDWVARGVFVDLLPVVKSSVRTSQPGYGLKKIEPLYMGDELRTGTVLDGAASVAGYERYAELRRAGQLCRAGDVLAEIADYNRYDCVSTLRLRDWLLRLRDAR
ncbi:TM0106 family RecB-like putative nuclease [Cumulibacter manganitolerans]|uniref:TM0106 family RecB-like putative nuclease n=1 Tax=Cumulibacter manganitolerans TaxID=1884992 RepID=UPI001294A2F3|nr:TM0106 family RecB-like putative nuclease [Cumulibacter manganitolerans]